MPERVKVVGVGAVSPAGFEAVGIADAVSRAHITTADELRASHGEVPAGQVPAIPAKRDAGDRRAHKLMSRGARLAAVAARSCLASTPWDDSDDVGFFLGVGASAARMTELDAVLRASYEDGALSMARLGAKGLRAFNPLRTFMLLPNFTMCHSALLEGTTGPNGTYFSRGTGTVTALMEAAYAVRSGACERALCGGADSALHPLTWAELRREGRADEGLVPGEGGAVLALEWAGAEDDAVELAYAGIFSTRRWSLVDAIAAAIVEVDEPVDAVVLAPWGRAARTALIDGSRRAWPGAERFDVTESLGEALAATPALGWAAAVDWLRHRHGRVAVLSAGIDGDIGAVVFEGGGGA